MDLKKYGHGGPDVGRVEFQTDKGLIVMWVPAALVPDVSVLNAAIIAALKQLDVVFVGAMK